MDTRYVDLGPLSEGLIPVEDTETNLCGFVDEKGNVVIEPVYYEANSFCESLADVRHAETEKWGFIDRTGEVKIPFIFDGSLGFNNGIAFVRKGDMLGCIDKEGKEVFPISVPESAFDFVEDVHDFFFDKPLNSIPDRSFNSETVNLFEFIAESKIRYKAQELIGDKKLSEKALEVLETKIQDKMKQVKAVINKKLIQNTEMSETILDEIENFEI